jgi:hypothetical protein
MVFYPHTSPSRQPKMDNFLKNLVFESSPLLLLLLSSSSVGREIFDLKFYRKYQRKMGVFTCKLKCDSEIRKFHVEIQKKRNVFIVSFRGEEYQMNNN